MSDYNEPTRLSREEARIQTYLDARNLRAMKNKTEEPEEPMKYSSSEEVDIMSDTPDKLSNVWRKEMAFLAQSEDISNNAIVDDLGFTPTKIKSDITQEMIDDYKAEQQTPLKLNGASYPYHPSRANIELEKFKPEALKIEDVPEAEEKIARLAGEYELLQIEISELDTTERTRIDDEYNDTSAKATQIANTTDEIKKLEDDIDYVNQGNRTKKELVKKAKELNIDIGNRSWINAIRSCLWKELRKKITSLKKLRQRQSGANTAEQVEADYRRQVQELEEAIAEKRDACAKILMEIHNIHDDLVESDEAFRRNRIEGRRIARENNEKLQTVYDELNILNAGQMVAQGQHESNEDFKARLIATGQETYSDKSDEEQAKLVQLEKCKNNLKKIITDVAKISTVANKLSSDEVFELNKYIVPITQKYLDTYGLDNKSMNEEDISQFIKDTVATKNFTSPNNASTPALGPAIAPYTIDPQRSPKENIVEFGRYHGLYIRGNHSILQIVKQIYDAGHVFPKPLIRIMRQDDVDRINATGEIELDGSGIARHISPPENYNGLGVKREQYSDHAPFGDYFISPHKLHFKNVLSIRSRTKKAINGYKDVRVSETLSAIIMKILKGETVHKHDLSSLNEKEQMMYDNLIYMSKLHKTHHNTVDATVQKMKNRLAILEGELDAGNDNPLILKELHDLVHKMAKSNIISQSSATEYWRDIKNNYID